MPKVSVKEVLGFAGVALILGGCGASAYCDRNIDHYRDCADGWSSPSIGRQGACSHHGGVVTKTNDRRTPIEKSTSEFGFGAGAFGFLSIVAAGAMPEIHHNSSKEEKEQSRKSRFWILLGVFLFVIVACTIDIVVRSQQVAVAEKARLDALAQVQREEQRQAEDRKLEREAEKRKKEAESEEAKRFELRELDRLSWGKEGRGVIASISIAYIGSDLKGKIVIEKAEFLREEDPITSVQFLDKDGLEVASIPYYSLRNGSRRISGDHETYELQVSDYMNERDYLRIKSWSMATRIIPERPTDELDKLLDEAEKKKPKEDPLGIK